MHPWFLWKWKWKWKWCELLLVFGGKPPHHHAVLRRPPPSFPFYRPPLPPPPLPRPSPATQRTCPCACNSSTTTTTTAKTITATGCPSSCPSRLWTPPTRRERRPKSPRIPPTRLALVRIIMPFYLCMESALLLLLLFTKQVNNKLFSWSESEVLIYKGILLHPFTACFALPWMKFLLLHKYICIS